MKRLYAPRDGMELMLLRSLLDASDVPYFVHNEHFGALEIGPRIDHFNARTIMVSEEAYPAAAEVLRQFLSDRGVERSRPRRRTGVWDAIRMALEVVLFGWIVPGRSRRRDPSSRWTVHEGGGREPER
jgi:Putative prokaryotic signal transducing protein